MPSKLTLFVILVLLAAATLAGVQLALAQAVITNGTITLGVNPHGHLNVTPPLGSMPSRIYAIPEVGLRFQNYEGLAGANLCEGWGVADADSGVNGWANRCFDDVALGGTSNLFLNAFTFSGDSTRSVVTINGPGGALLEVTHEWVPSFSPNLYQGNVVIRNVNDGGTVGRAANDGIPGGGDIRYRRVIDWEVEPSLSEEYVTIGGVRASVRSPFLRFTSDDGFEIPNPLRFQEPSFIYPLGEPVDIHADTQAQFDVDTPVPCGFTTDFTNCGRFIDPLTLAPIVTDHGALFDFAFPSLPPTAIHQFAIFYGATATRADAELALYNVGAEVYSFGNCQSDILRTVNGEIVNGACNPASGTPVTFVFGAAGLGGGAAFGDISGTVFGDVDGNGVGGGGDFGVSVTVTLSGTDIDGNLVARTVVSDTDGAYYFPAVPRGTYNVSVPAVHDGLAASTANPALVTIGGTFPYVIVDFGYCPTSATTVASSLNPSTFGEPVTFTATVQACGAPASLGSVTFSEGGTILSGPSDVDSTGKATYTADLSAGNHVITATYTSGTSLLGSSADVTQVVNPAVTLTVLASSANPSTFGQAVTFTATVRTNETPVTAGTVTFKEGVTVLAGPVAVVDGEAQFTTSTLTVSSHAIAAVYESGTPNILGSAANLTQVVNPVATVTAVVSSLNPSITGQAVTFTATVTSAGEAVTAGAVTFREGSTVLAGSVALNGSGQASFTTSTLAAGPHVITADYGGATGYNASTGTVTQAVNDPAVTESCFTLHFREVTYFKTSHVIMSSDAAIRSQNGIGGGYNPSVWPYSPSGGTNKTVSRGTLFRIYGFDNDMVGQTIPNADDPAITYTVQADPQIQGVYYVDLGGPAKVRICPSQLQIKLIEGTPIKPWSLPGTAQLAEAKKNVPGILLNHNVERIEIPQRVRNELAALGTPLKNPNGSNARFGLVDYVGVQQWGHGNANFREHVDLQIQFVADDPANRPLHYQVGFHTAKNRDFEGFVSCDYVDYNPGNDGVRMNDVWAGTNAGNPNWGPACGSLEPSINQRKRENYAVPLNAAQILSTVNTHDDTLRVYYGTIRPAGN